MPLHRYAVTVAWTGNRGEGTATYRGYGRDHVVRADGKPELLGSSDPAFRGDASRWNPEELFVASLSTCHQLWYLHLCAQAGIVVVDYVDRAEGTMEDRGLDGGRFVEVVLRPEATIVTGDPETARTIHEEAHVRCFVANSVAIPVRVEPTIRRSAAAPA